MKRQIKINDWCFYHDGIFWTCTDLEIQGFYIKSGFNWNGVTGWRTGADMLKASLIHDFLLRVGADRGFCLDCFKNQMKIDGVGFFRRSIFGSVVYINDFLRGG